MEAFFERNACPLRPELTQEEQRRHFTPRSVEEFSMRTGVPDEILNGDTPDDWTPDWAPTLEERFHNTVKGWLHNGLALAKQMRQAKDEPLATGVVTPPVGMAFVPSPTDRCKMDLRSARANDAERRRWMSLVELGSKARRSSGVCPGLALRLGMSDMYTPCDGHGDPTMILGFRGRRAGGIRFRRILFSGASSARRTGANLFAEPSGVDTKTVKLSIMEATGAESPKNNLSAKPKMEGKAEAKVDTNGGILEAPESPVTPLNLISSLLGGAIDMYDSAVSFVGCVLVTSPLGKHYLKAYDGHHPLPTSPVDPGRHPTAMSSAAYDLVGFSNIDPFEASGRRSGGYPSRMP